eukprot:SM000013S26392  [mRNA]  locus=s13:183972:187291:- [translate_table: standard]
MVVLASDGVTDDGAALLEADGWLVERISLVANPNRRRPARFWGVYTKLRIFNMTAYDKVVYLDADTIVVKSIEDLFLCRGFCANVKHSERLNSGVMVVEPDAGVFDDMIAKITSLESYTGGDQGFLNSYYPDFPNALLFDPSLTAKQRAEQSPAMERLSVFYNADVGLFMLANKWMVDEALIRVVHFTLGPLKPWDWWTSWLLTPVQQWQEFRSRLPGHGQGTERGRNPRQLAYVRALFLLPVAVVAFLHRRMVMQACAEAIQLLCKGSYIGNIARQLWHKYRPAGSPLYSSVQGNGAAPLSSTSPMYMGAAGVASFSVVGRTAPAMVVPLAVAACFVYTLGAWATAMSLIPRQVMPWTGVLLMYEWTFLLFLLAYGRTLALFHAWGRAAAGAAALELPEERPGPSKVHSKVPDWESETAACALGMMVLALLVPATPFVLHVTALFARLGVMVGGGMLFVSTMTLAARHTALRWFQLGYDSRSQSRSQDSAV